MEDRHSLLGNESITRLIVKFSIPAVAGMTVTALYNVIDRIFVGRGVGSDALSGVVLTFPIMMIILGFSLLISVGTASMVSIKLGQKKKDEAEDIIGNAFALSMALGIILSAVCLVFMKPVLIAFGGEGTPLLYAEQFMQVALFSIVFQMIGFTLNGAIRSEGNAMIALLTLVIGNAINLILNPLFIFVLHLGVRGSSLATLISQIVTSAWTFFYFANKKSLLRLRIRNLRLKPIILKEILSIGLAPFILQNALSLMLIISNIVFKKFGNGEGLAVVGIIMVISMLFNQVVTGMQRGIQPIIGYNYGAKNFTRVKKTMELSIIITTMICSIGFIPIFFFSREIISLFTEQRTVLSLFGPPGLKYALITLPLLGFLTIGSGYFTSVGKFKQALFIIIIRQAAIIILLLILPGYFGFYGGITAYPLADLITTAITALMMAIEWRNLKVNSDNTEKQEKMTINKVFSRQRLEILKSEQLEASSSGKAAELYETLLRKESTPGTSSLPGLPTPGFPAGRRQTGHAC